MSHSCSTSPLSLPSHTGAAVPLVAACRSVLARPSRNKLFKTSRCAACSGGLASFGGTRQREYVNWFREAWPYIQGHRTSTFVVVVPGELVANSGILDSVLQDISLLHGLGIRIVLVPGTHIQMDNLLRERGCKPKYVGAYRITDADALDAAMEAAGKVRVRIEAKLSRGPVIPVLRRHGENDRWHEAGISVASGNFLSSKRRGVVNGVDFGATGEVKKIDVSRITERLDSNCIVLVSNVGYSSTGEVLNCNTYEVATACAVALQADKLLCLLDGPVFDENNFPIRFMTLGQADQLIRKRACQSYTAADYVKAVAGFGYVKRLGLLKMFENENENEKNDHHHEAKKTERGFAIGGEERQSRTYGYLSELAASVYVCRAGVRRVHLLNGTIEGALLLELYTRDGIGTMISSDMYEGIRGGGPKDVRKIEVLLHPLEEAGILVKRSREQLEEDIGSYIVVERDGSVVACCSLHLYPEAKTGEVGAFAVSSECRGHGIGDNLLDYVEKKALAMHLEKLFVLTTRTVDWFMHRGFVECSIDEIPPARQQRINFSRGSKYYMKQLQPVGPVLSFAPATRHSRS